MDTRDKVVEIIIEQLAIPANEMKDDGSLVKDYNMDEVDLSEIAMALEDEFDISIEDEVMQSWMTVKDVIEYIKEATKK